MSVRASLQKCRHCGSFSAQGKEGPTGSEYANKWYCVSCWQAWDMQFQAPSGQESHILSPSDKASSPPRVDLKSMTVKELRKFAQSQGIDLSTCVEKSEIMTCLARFGAKSATAEAASASASPIAVQTSSSQWQAMSTGELRRECKAHGIDTTNCVEKDDLVNRLRSRISSDTVHQAGFKTLTIVGERHENSEQSSMRDILRAHASDIIDMGPEHSVEDTSHNVFCADATATLRAAVLTFNVSNVVEVVDRLGSGAEAHLSAVDADGRGLLHLCGANAVKQGVGSIVRFLLNGRTAASSPDFAGRFPLDLAIEASIGATGALLTIGLDTIRAFLSHGIDLESSQCFSADPAIAKALTAPEATPIVELLLDFGATSPWLSHLSSSRDTEPVICELEQDISEVGSGHEGFDSDGLEELDMEATWRAQINAAGCGRQSPNGKDVHTGAIESIDLKSKMLGSASSKARFETVQANDHKFVEHTPAATLPVPPGKPHSHKPLSLRAAVKAFDIEAVKSACEVLGNHAEAALDAIDGRGQTLLHVCGARAADSNASQVVRILLQKLACATLQDSSRQVPLMLAVSAVLSASSSERAHAMDTVRALLVAGMPSGAFAAWHSETCDLASACTKSSADPGVLECVELLQESGADLPWHRLSLRSGVESCDPGLVRNACRKLSDNKVQALRFRYCHGRSLLHICAENLATRGAASVLKLLIAESADVNMLNDEGSSPLIAAVSSGICAPKELQCDAQDAIEKLLVEGASPALVQEWVSEDCLLACAASSIDGNAVAELLLRFGANLPWHPMSLQASVQNCDVLGSQNAMTKLGANITSVVQMVDDDGRTLLHVSAMKAASFGAAEICEDLLKCSASVNYRTPDGRTPLDLSVSAVIELQSQTTETVVDAALNTVRAILKHRGDLSEDWLSEGSLLAEAAKHYPGKALVNLLVEHKVSLPWYDRYESLREQCCEFRIPHQKLGFIAASNVLKDVMRWRSMSVKDLRSECRSRKLQTDDCLEKEDIVSRLCQVRIYEEVLAIEHPQLNYVGAWCYGKGPTEYNLHVDANGQLSFDGPHSSAGRLRGHFHEGLDGWMEAQLSTINGVSAGVIRIRYNEEDRTMHSNYRSATMAEWGRDILSRKHVLLSSTTSGSGVADDGAPREFAHEPVDSVSSEVEATAEIPDIESAEDLPAAFMAAVTRHDIDAVRRGLARATREAEGDPLEEVEILINMMDIDCNTNLHHCVVGPRVPGASSAPPSSKHLVTEITKVLIEAQGDVNSENLVGETVLLAAVRAPRATPIEVVRVLLVAGALPDHADTLTGETALMEAACRGELELCQLLLESRADAARTNSQGLMARDLAAEFGHKSVSRLLRLACPPRLSDDVLQKMEKLWMAASSFDIVAVHLAMEQLGDDAETVVEMPRDGRTLLHVMSASASKDDAAEILRLLLQFCTRLDLQDDAGLTPLALAVSAAVGEQENQYAVLDTVRALLNAGAPVDVESWVDPQSELALASQTKFGHAICSLLCAFGAEMPWFDASPHTRNREEDSMQDETSSLELRARCQEQGIPYDNIGRASAESILRDSERWCGMKVSQLREECELQRLPTSDCVEKKDFVTRLQQIRIWHEASMSFLEKECLIRGASVAFDFASREEIVTILRSHAFGICEGVSSREQQKYSDKGIPVDRISIDKATMIYDEIKRFESCKISELKREHEKFGLKIEAGAERQDMVKRIRDILVWQALPLEELCKECEQNGITSADISREQLVVRLISAKWATIAGCGSRFPNFFDRNKEQKLPAEEQKRQRPDTSKCDDWESQAEYNRRQFAQGNRRHAGMPTGARKFGPGFNAGRFGPQSRQYQQQQQHHHQHHQRQVGTPAPNLSSHFRDLGLPPTAKLDEVRKAYRRLALKYHPDKNLNDQKEVAATAFQRIQSAYDCICEHLRAKGGVAK